MKKIGPFIVQKSDADSSLVWCEIILGGYQNQRVCSINQAPFHENSVLPKAFEKLNPEPLNLHAFDPSNQQYFLFTITTEHRLFRSKLITSNKKRYLTDQYTGHAWAPLQSPPFDISEQSTNTCSDMLSANNNPLKTNIQKQYQDAQPPPPWGHNQNIPSPNTFPEALRAVGSINGFFFAWEDLKTTAPTPLTYYYALFAVITKKSTITFFKIESLADEIQNLRRYLIDPSIYKSDQPLDAALFEATRDALALELEALRNTLENPADHILNSEDILTFKEAADEDAILNFSKEKTDEIVSDCDFLLTNPNMLNINVGDLYQLEAHLHALTTQNKKYDGVYAKLRLQIHPEIPLDSRIESKLEQIRDKLESILRDEIMLLLLNNLNNKIRSHLLPLLKTSEEAHIAFSMLVSIEQTTCLLDALQLESADSPFLQTISDLSTLAAPLESQAIKHLFSKRTPLQWGKLIQSIEDLKKLSFIFGAAERKKIYAKHAVSFAGLINSTEAFTHIFPAMSIGDFKSLLPRIPLSVRQHWIQTPEQLEGFFVLSTRKACYRTNITAFLNAIPSPYRVTALMQSDRHNEKAALLGRGSADTVQHYWNALSPVEWALLLDNPKPLLKALMEQESASSNIRFQLPTLIEKLYLHLMPIHATGVSTEAIDQFEDLKLSIVALFPEIPHTCNFFRPEISTAALSSAMNIPMLKRALMRLYILTDSIHVESKILCACCAIQAHEEAPKEEKEEHEHDSKRSCIR
ncbi:MAG: hypothetical protein QNK11_05435 [Legionella sp.]|nr:hypothetical protein [Legionella sp.]